MSELVFNRNFYCHPPCETFTVTDDYKEGDDEKWYCICPKCGKSVPETKYKENLHVSVKTGPKTIEGKKQATANLEGHRGQFTTEEARDRVSQNAFKHGLYSQQPHIIAPAKPGKYPMCSGCELREECEAGFSYCPMNMGPVMQFLKAYKEGNHAELKDIAGLSQAQMFSMLQMSLHEVFDKGTLVLDKHYYKGQISKELYKANPVMSKIIDMMSSLGFTADQQEMTPKSADEADVLKGSLEKGSTSTEEAVARIEASNKELLTALETSHKNREEDPALKDFEEQEGED